MQCFLGDVRGKGSHGKRVKQNSLTTTQASLPKTTLHYIGRKQKLVMNSSSKFEKAALEVILSHAVKVTPIWNETYALH